MGASDPSLASSALSHCLRRVVTLEKQRARDAQGRLVPCRLSPISTNGAVQNFRVLISRGPWKHSELRSWRSWPPYPSDGSAHRVNRNWKTLTRSGARRLDACRSVGTSGQTRPKRCKNYTRWTAFEKTHAASFTAQDGVPIAIGFSYFRRQQDLDRSSPRDPRDWHDGCIPSLPTTHGTVAKTERNERRIEGCLGQRDTHLERHPDGSLVARSPTPVSRTMMSTLWSRGSLNTMSSHLIRRGSR